MGEPKLPNIYHASGIQPPTVEHLRKSAANTGLELTDKQLQDYVEEIAQFVPCYTLTASLAEPTLPVKYPRTPGYRPTMAENTHNAWYWKTDIKGASSGILEGKKVAVKDAIAVAGVPMMNGSRILEGYIPEFDATVVTRILDAGGHIVGKAACEDLSLGGGSCTNAKAPVCNPVDPERSAGGSSSGSATLLALGEVDLALGADQGGSIRIPASWCGITGLKPTYGLVPYCGAMSIEPSIDHLGPMARDVQGVALLLEAIAGPEPLDFRQPSTLTVPKYSQLLTGNIEGMKIGFLQEGFSKCKPNVQEVVKATMPVFESLGATAEWVSIPQHYEATAVWTPVIFDGLWNNSVVGEGSGMGWRGFYPSSLCEHVRRGRKAMANCESEPVKMIMLLGDYVKRNYGNQFYNKAQNLCPVYTKCYDDMLDKYDVLVMPTLPLTAPRQPSKDLPMTELFTEMFDMIVNTSPANYTGHPALSLNVGFSDGLPVGGMLYGKKFDEVKILNIAYALEQALKSKQ